MSTPRPGAVEGPGTALFVRRFISVNFSTHNHQTSGITLFAFIAIYVKFQLKLSSAKFLRGTISYSYSSIPVNLLWSHRKTPPPTFWPRKSFFSESTAKELPAAVPVMSLLPFARSFSGDTRPGTDHGLLLLETSKGRGEVFYGQEPPSTESTATVRGVNYHY